VADPNDPWAAFNPQAAPQTASPFGNHPVIQGPPPEPKTTYRSLTPDEIKSRRLNPLHSYQISSQGGINDLGANSPESQQQKQIPVQAASGIQGNLETLRQIESALRDLDPKSPKARPQSIGPGTGLLGDTFTQFNDPEGTGVRSDVGKIGATTIHDLSGAAVSATEAPRFQPFVPTVQDRPEVALDKLRKFHDALGAQINEQLHFYSPDNGYMPYKGPQADAFLHGGQVSPPDPQQQEQAPPAPTVTEKGFGIAPSGSTPTKSSEDFRNQLFSAMKSKQIKSTAELKAWQEQYNQSHGTGWSIDLKNPETASALRSALSGKSFNIEQPTPDISDVRGGNNTGVQDTFNSLVRGVTDTATSGTIDKLVAGADTLFKGGPMDYNQQRQYAISDFDQANHPIARLGGQVLGGAALPFGEENTAASLAAKGGAYGTAYGVGSSRSLSDVPVNASVGGAFGAAVPFALGKVFKPKAGAIDPLVDPVTGELNQPMNAMKPADRVQSMRDYGMKTITPGMAGGRSARVIEQGFNNLPGSAGHMEDVNAAASGELRRSMQGVAQQFGTSKTLNEGGAALQAGAVARNERAEGVIAKAYNAVPISDQAPAAKNSTIATLQDLTGRFQSNPKLAEALHDPKLASYLDAFQSGNISWNDLKQFRSIIGEKIGEMRFGESSSTSDLRSLYAALSEDMRTTASQQGPGALHAFERANSLYRNNEQLIQNSLTRILGKDGQMKPEQAAAAVQAMTQGGKAGGDLKTLAQIRAATIKSGAWDEIASTLIHLGGQPAKSEGRAFQPATFVNWYADMSEPARAMLFKPELRKSLDGFVSMNQQLARIKGLSNTSNTTPTMIGSGLVGAGGVAAVTHPMVLLGMIGGGVANYGMARFWTTPIAVKLLTGYGRAVASGNANAVNSQVGRLAKLASTNPELSAPIKQLLSALNDNAPRMGSAAASPDGGPDQEQQPQR
jgi:hypothetical protein